MNHDIDRMIINFNGDAVVILKFVLALIMLGVTLDIRVKDIKNILKHPRSIFAGLFAQFFLLPAMTFVIIYFANPIPSLALGMILVAACPGGNVSNLFTLFAKGNTALSVSLTFLATILALVMTPFNIQFWGNLYGPTQKLVQEVALDPYEVATSIFFVLGIFMGSVLWWLTVSTLASYLQKKIDRDIIPLIHKFSGILILFFAFFLMIFTFWEVFLP